MSHNSTSGLAAHSRMTNAHDWILLRDRHATRKRRKFLRAGMVAIVAALLLTASPAAAIRYRFTELANTDTFLSFIDTPSINDGGAVAVVVFTDAGGQLVVSQQAVIADTTDPSQDFTNLFDATINNNGTVAFSALTSPLAGGIYARPSGGLITTIVDNSASLKIDGTPIDHVFIEVWDLSDSGNVLFDALLTNGRTGIYQRHVSGGEIFRRIEADSSDFFFLNPATNSLGKMAVMVDFRNGENRQIIQSDFGTFMDTDDEFDVRTSSRFDLIDMNNHNQVAFLANLDTGDRGIFVFSDATGEVTRLVDTSGPFANLATPSINNTGGVAFVATLDAGGGEGVFRGPNPVADKIIGIGDVIGTRNGTVRTVAGVGFGNDGFGSLGRVAFTVRDQLGTQYLISGIGLNPDIDLNNVAQLSTVTDNKRDITQEFTFPSFSDTQLMFDYRNLTPGATLIVSINGIEVGNVVPRGTMSDFLSASFPIDPIFLSGDNDIPEILKFELSGGSGMTFQLDNIRFSNLNLVNGDFSTGDLSGWQFGDGDGVVMVTNGLDLIFVPEPATAALVLPNFFALILAFSRRLNRSVPRNAANQRFSRCIN